MKKYFTFLVTFIPTIFMICFILLILSISYHSTVLNDYQAQVEQIISHSGGLNDGAKQATEQLSKNHFDDMFSVSSNDNNVGYQKDIHYKINANVPIKFNVAKLFNNPIQFSSGTFSTKSLIRQNSETYNQ